MKLKIIRMKMSSCLSIIFIIEAVLICIVSFISINLFYRTYTELLYNESAEVLNLYFSRVEDRLKEVEKLSFGILSDITIQEYFSEINNYGDTYEGYVAQQKVRNKLLYYLFLVDDVFSIDYITNSSQQLNAGYAAVKAYSMEELNEISEIAYKTYGSGSWEVNISGSGTVSFVRLITPCAM